VSYLFLVLIPAVFAADPYMPFVIRCLDTKHAILMANGRNVMAGYVADEANKEKKLTTCEGRTPMTRKTVT
jgi:hypothetical protein